MIVHVPLKIKLTAEMYDRLSGLINRQGPLPEYDLSLLARAPFIEDQNISVRVHIDNDEFKTLEVRAYRHGSSMGVTRVELLDRDLAEKFVCGLKEGLALIISFEIGTE